MTLGFEGLEKRAGEIATETAEADKEMIESLNAELDAIEERKMALNLEIEERKKAAEAVANGAGKEVEERTEKKMTDREIRSSKEYIDMYVDYVKKGYDLSKIEKRDGDFVLLTENAGESGTLAVPTYVEDRIRESWERDEIMRRVRKTFIQGNVKVGVEVESDGAVIHQEGAEAIAAEELNIEFVNLIPEYIKKMVKVSHTAMALKGTAFLDYLYDEIQYQIVKKAGKEVLNAIKVSNFLQTVSLEVGASLTTADIITAEGLLAGDANPVLIISRANVAALKAAVLSAGYGYDPFDGLEVIYADADAIPGKALLVDLNAVQCNFPEGAEPRFIFDEFTEAPSNIVRIIGRLLMGCALVGTGKAVNIAGGEV